MVKAFDPDKAREAAEATIKAAQDVRAKLVEKVTKAEEKVTAANDAMASAIEAKQKVVDAAESARAAAKQKVAEQDVLIARQQNFLDATAPPESDEVIASTEADALLSV